MDNHQRITDYLQRPGGQTMDEIISIILTEPMSVVFVALVKSVCDLGYVVKSLNKGEGLLDFQTGISLRSWHGQVMRAKLIDRGGKTTELRISGAFRGGYAILHGLDWGEAERTSQKIIGRTLDYLAGESRRSSKVLYPLWFCPECSTMNGFWLSACVKCGRQN